MPIIVKWDGFQWMHMNINNNQYMYLFWLPRISPTTCFNSLYHQCIVQCGRIFLWTRKWGYINSNFPVELQLYNLLLRFVFKIVLVWPLLSDRSNEVAKTVLFWPLLHEGTGCDSQQGEPVQDSTLPPRGTGQAGRDLRGLESICQDEGQGKQQIYIFLLAMQ